MKSPARRTRFRTLPLIVMLAVPLAACDAENEQGRDLVDRGVISEQQLATLSDEDIARLAEQYPRLVSDTPLPPPQPNGGPTEPPARLVSALSEPVLETVTGEATFYADRFEGRRTASGVPFRQNQFVAAHRAYPFGTVLRVTNTRNDRAVNVRVVDRGPFGSSAKQKRTVIDLSRRAAERLGFINAGRAQVNVEVLEWGSGVATS